MVMCQMVFRTSTKIILNTLKNPVVSSQFVQNSRNFSLTSIINSGW